MSPELWPPSTSWVLAGLSQSFAELPFGAGKAQEGDFLLASSLLLPTASPSTWNSASFADGVMADRMELVAWVPPSPVLEYQ